MVFGQQAIDVEASGAVGERGRAAGVSGGRDLEGVGRGGRVNGASYGVERAGLDAAREFALPLVPMGIKLEAAFAS